MTFHLDSIKVTEGQKSLATYIKRETGKVVKPESIALVEALRAEYRKDPDRVAERTAVQEAARGRKQAALDKSLERLRKQAKALGLEVQVGGAAVQEEADEDEDEDDGPVEAEPETNVVQIKATPAKKTRKITVVPDADDFEDGPVTLPVADTSDGVEGNPDIAVIESADGWTQPEDDDEDADDF